MPKSTGGATESAVEGAHVIPLQTNFTVWGGVWLHQSVWSVTVFARVDLLHQGGHVRLPSVLRECPGEFLNDWNGIVARWVGFSHTDVCTVVRG